MKTIFKRELKSYFNNMTAYIFIAFMLVVCGIYTTFYNFKNGLPYFEYSLYSIMFIFLVIIPLLTMRSFSQEKHEKTDQLLYSLPMKLSSIVLGKYFAMLTVYAIPMAVMSLYPLILRMFGSVNFKQSYSSIFAYFLLGAALIAIGMFVSSLTESQVIAAVLGLGALLGIYMLPNIASMIPSVNIASYICFAVLVIVFAFIVYSMTKSFYASVITGFVLEIPLLVLYLVKPDIFGALFPNMLIKLAIFNRFLTFAEGTFDLGGIIYFLSVICVFIFLTTQSLEKKRYS